MYIALEINTLEYASACLKVEATGQLLPHVLGKERPQSDDRLQVVLALVSWCQCFKMISSSSKAFHDQQKWF